MRVLAALLSLWWAVGASGQTIPSAPSPAAKTPEPPSLTVPADNKTEIVDPKVEQAGCPTCGGGLLSGGGHVAPVPGCASCGWGADCGTPGECGCGGPCCKPGRPCCQPCTGDTCIGRCWCRFYDCVCCPDPCYEPHWVAAADAGFFLDSARPVTQFKIRFDALQGMDFPDRAEFFWSRTGGKGKGPSQNESGLDSRDLYMINEVGGGKFSLTTEVPYRHVDPDINQPASGFGDVRIATKALLLDCELMQFAFQFKTFIPSGTGSQGLGLGHVALEPALLCTAKLTPLMYLQSELAIWCPIGGDPNVQGAVLHTHFSLNRVLWHVATDLQLVGSAEVGGWFFQSGNYTDPATGNLVPATHDSFFAAGGGLRLVMCDKMDIGVGAEVGFSPPLIFDSLIRIEFRYRF
ncbi:hypothetical protein AYO44_02865 [Planctomycetaceae bacterium SCGC AG-212-F19]|nr:hypothetical protein AYO44_02865 [Planctomycetaceae bacterium SCGC AG-212-F19]